MAEGSLEGLALMRRIFSVIRRAMRLSTVAYLVPAGDAAYRVAIFLGPQEEGLAREGQLVRSLQAAQAVVSQRKPILFNADRQSLIRPPYGDGKGRARGAMALLLREGILWADRHEGPIGEEEFQVFQDLAAFIEEEREFHNKAFTEDARFEYLSQALDSVQSILASSTERECMTCLLNSATRLTSSEVGLVATVGEEGAYATVVAASGPSTERFVGQEILATEGLIGLAIRAQTVVPTSRRFTASMDPLLCRKGGLKLRDGDPIIVHPIGGRSDTVGALLLAKGVYDGLAVYGVRSLCDAAALITMRLRLQERIVRDAMMDGLTGLYNRKAFLTHLSEIFALCRRHSYDLSLLMIDIDHFKDVNDRYGHIVGDQALRFVSEIIRHNLRESDIAGRYGGEEFVVALPHTPLSGAVMVAERLRQACAASKVTLGGVRLGLTISVGVADLSHGPKGPLGLIEMADEALYEAKNGGRNRVVAWSQLRA